MGQHRHLRGGGFVDDTAFVNDSVFVEKTATVGARTYIGHGAYVEAGITVGTDCIICDRVRVTANVPDGTTIDCDCCEGGSDEGDEEMVLASAVFAYDGFVAAGPLTLIASPATADWNLAPGSEKNGLIPVNPMTGLATRPVALILSLWMYSQQWDTDAAGMMIYAVHLHDGSVIASGVWNAATAFTGKMVLVNTILAAGIVDNNAGVYVTWTTLGASGEGQVSQRLNLSLSATPAP